MLFALLALPLPALQEEPPAPAPASQEAAQGPQESAPLTPGTVIATVGDVELTYQELLAEMNRLIPLTTYHGRIPEGQQFEFRDQALANLIERSLVLQDAERRGLQAGDEELRAELRKSIQMAGAADRVDEKMFEELLAQLGPVIRKRVLIDKNEARFRETIPPVTEEQMRASFEAQQEHLVTPELVHVREILLKVEPGSTEEQALKVRDRMQRVLDGLLDGGDFETSAMLHSEHESGPAGGDRGWIPVGGMRAAELNGALAELKDGETSGLVRSRWGYHLIQRVATQAPRPMTFAEVEAGLRRELEKRNESAARATWMDELRDRYPVEVRDVLPPAPDKSGASDGAE